MRIAGSVLLVASIIAAQATLSVAATIVLGSANPNLAGRADGYQCCGGDLAPAQSPPVLTGELIEDCATMHITATGKVHFAPGLPTGNNPDGDSVFSMTTFNDGISAPLNVRANALVGVFLTDASATGAQTPAPLDFADGLGFAQLDPGIAQIFFIGDGLTSDSNAGDGSGSEQAFVVPPGATRLFFGTGDGGGWYNNSGSFSVEVSSEPEVRERECGDPAEPAGIAASDALIVLRAAVGTSLCQECVCDVDRSGKILASDALTVLRHAVGQPVEVGCSCCPHLD